MVCVVIMVLGAGLSSAQMGGNSVFNASDTRELKNFRLTDDMVQKFQKATNELIAYGKAHRSDGDKNAKASASGGNISDMVNSFSKVPQFETILHNTGMTPKEYADTMLVLSTGYAMVSMQKQGMAVSKMTDLVSAENTDYIKRNLRSPFQGVGAVKPFQRIGRSQRADDAFTLSSDRDVADADGAVSAATRAKQSLRSLQLRRGLERRHSQMRVFPFP